MSKIEVTIEIDDQRLDRYDDTRLAMLWHVAQANPADPFEDQAAGRLVERIGREIIRRWLKATEPELWHHQGEHYFWKQLCKLAEFEPGPGEVGSPEWLDGRWVPRAAGEQEGGESE